MVNNDRIVPVMKIDLLSLYGTILKIAGAEIEVLEADDVLGKFTVSTEALYLCNQPVKSIHITGEEIGPAFYFVAGYDFDGFYDDAGKIDVSGIDDIVKDAATLYYCEPSELGYTLSAVTPALSSGE